MIARISIPQEQIGLVRPGMEVELRTWGDADKVYEGVVTSRSEAPLGRLPHPALSAAYGGETQVKLEEKSKDIPLYPTYEALITLKNKDGILMPGQTGWARIIIRKSTIGGRLWRAILEAIDPSIRLFLEKWS
jgi:hypothetical protein